MNYKRIKYLPPPAPLERVILEFYFNDEFNLNLTDAAKIAQNVTQFKREPNLVLLPKLLPNETIEFPAMGRLKFSDEENKNWLEIGKDHILFIFSEYTRWKELIFNLIENLFKLKEILKFKTLKEIRISYIDKFTFKSEDFLFEKYFTISLNKPGNWKIYPHDIFIGILPYEEENKKLIMRLRSLPNIKKDSDEFEFQLESILIDRNVNLIIEKEKLIDYLTNAHDLIITHFVEILTEEHQKKMRLELDGDNSS